MNHTSSQANAFDLCEVAKTYRLGQHPIPVLAGVTCDIRRGEWVALVGASGSGKTTLMHLLGALDKPTSGTIACLGIPWRGAVANRLRKRQIGFVFQSYHLLTELSALENVALPACGWGDPRGAARQRAEALLRRFGLGDRLPHRPLELSGGEQQRVAIARALINNPQIILADEPTGNLDAEAAANIMDILAELHHSEGKTIVMVTHDQQCAAHADRILTLNHGKIADA